MSPTDSGNDSSSRLTRKSFLAVCGTLFALLFLVVLIHVHMATQMDDIEAVMVGVEGPSSISFVRPGIVLQSE